MKIEGPRGVGSVGSSRKASASGASGFSLPSEGPSAAAEATGIMPTLSVDGVFALQAQGFDPNRRGRQVKRASATLDALEGLARAHLEGAAPHAQRLQLTALRAQSEATGDPGLDSVLDDIDVRAAVELAKLDVAERQMKQSRIVAGNRS
jgi:hypothetical protein